MLTLPARWIIFDAIEWFMLSWSISTLALAIVDILNTWTQMWMMAYAPEPSVNALIIPVGQPSTFSPEQNIALANTARATRMRTTASQLQMRTTFLSVLVDTMK